MINKILSFVLLTVLYGCAHVNGDVRFLKDQNADIASWKKYNIKIQKYDNDSDYLTSIDLLNILKDKMSAKGFIFDKDHPEFIADLSFKCEPKQTRDNAFLWFKHDVTYNTHYIKIAFIPVNSEKPAWLGEVLAADEDLGTDIRQCAPSLIKEVLSEYPNGSGKDANRKIYTPGRHN